ncbi:PhyH-domain-containing protein [Tothia fuscella]|uniref:PhyH-domain-containing protein n=1 Tax=Tothia fuscella TaxID=1048955 RepID=A0A9P4NTZ2_9PEZI|nr:PhyH-domain-containing protein [Tothia fuscella]
MSSPSLQKLPTTAGAEAILKVVEQDGGVIIGGFLTADQVSRFNAELQPDMDKLNIGSNPDHIDAGDGDDFQGAQTKRLVNVVNASKTFRAEVIEIELLHQLYEKTFCDRRAAGYWFNTSQVIEIGPHNKAQPLHRDQELYPFWNALGPQGPEATVNFLVALSPFTEQNGATRIVPGSHLWPHFEDTFLEGGVHKHDTPTIAAEMNPGDCVFFSGKLLHGGGHNQTNDENRRGIDLSVIRIGLMPENANPLAIPRDIIDSMSYRGQAMCGFRSLWPPKHGLTSAFWTSDYGEVGKALGLKEKAIVC